MIVLLYNSILWLIYIYHSNNIHQITFLTFHLHTHHTDLVHKPFRQSTFVRSYWNTKRQVERSWPQGVRGLRVPQRSGVRLAVYSTWNWIWHVPTGQMAALSVTFGFDCCSEWGPVRWTCWNISPSLSSLTHIMWCFCFKFTVLLFPLTVTGKFLHLAWMSLNKQTWSRREYMRFPHGAALKSCLWTLQILFLLEN